MNKEDNNDNLGAPMMERAEKPPHIQLGNDLDDTLMGMLEIRDIVEREDHACYELNDKEKKGDAAGQIPYFVFVDRDKFLFRKIPDFIEVVSL
jgi:hypothetical protein